MSSTKTTADQLPTAVTLQGNSFNGVSQLVQLDGSGKLPAIDGSALTGVTGGTDFPSGLTTTAVNAEPADGSSITVLATNGSTVDGGEISITGGSGGGPSFNGGQVGLFAGNAGAAGTGGNVVLDAGNSSAGEGGYVFVNAGSGGIDGGGVGIAASSPGTGVGGPININGGNDGGTGTGGGSITLTGGNSASAGPGGNVNLVAGTGSTPGVIALSGKIQIAAGATNGYVFTSDASGFGTWQSSGGGGGSPAGSDTQVQFNSSGAFGASFKFAWDDTNAILGLQGHSSGAFSNGALNLSVANSAGGGIAAGDEVIQAFGAGALHLKSTNNLGSVVGFTMKQSGGNARIGIQNTSPGSLFDILGLFQIDDNGNIVKINNVATSWPATQGGMSTVLTNDGFGNFSWQTPAGGVIGGGGTAPGMAFFSGSTSITSDANIAWNAANKSLLIGGSASNLPSTIPSVEAVGDGNPCALISTVFANTSSQPNIIGMRAGGSVASPTATPSGQKLVSFAGMGYTGSAFDISNPGGSMDFIANELFSVSAHGTDWRLRLCPAGSTSGTVVVYATAAGSGKVGIGNSSPTSMLSVGSSSQFQVDSNGNIVNLNNVVTSFPSSQGAANNVLKNDGSGNLSWTGTVPNANNLKSATTTINVSSATAPSSGQVLTATGGTAATWQTPAAAPVFLPVIGSGSLVAGASVYTWVSGVNASESLAQSPMPRAGTIANLFVDPQGSTAPLSSTTFTVRKNGVDTALTVTIGAGSSALQSDTTHSVSFAAGDLIDLEVTSDSTPAAVGFSTSLTIA